MIYRNPQCVYVANVPVEAYAAVLFLAQRGVPAQVMNEDILTGCDGFGPNVLTGKGAEGLEVWVKDMAQAAQALQLLAEQKESKAAQTEQAAARGPVDALCEQCAKVSQFPGAQRGSVQECQHCRAYLDVPGVDEGAAEMGPIDNEADFPREDA